MPTILSRLDIGIRAQRLLSSMPAADIGLDPGKSANACSEFFDLECTATVYLPPDLVARINRYSPSRNLTALPFFVIRDISRSLSTCGRTESVSRRWVRDCTHTRGTGTRCVRSPLFELQSTVKVSTSKHQGHDDAGGTYVCCIGWRSRKQDCQSLTVRCDMVVMGRHIGKRPVGVGRGH